MFTFSIVQAPIFDIKTKSIDRILLCISKIVPKKQNGVLNIVFLDDESIKNLNKKYRNINKETDVLSFHYFDNFNNIEKNEISGEIIMSEKKIISGGKEFLLETQMEFYKLLIHSVLHILGYDHEKENDYKVMNEFEKKIWIEVFEK